MNKYFVRVFSNGSKKPPVTKEVDGELVSSVNSNAKLILHQTPNDEIFKWVACEYATGLFAGGGRTKKLAIQAANDNIGRLTDDQLFRNVQVVKVLYGIANE